MTSAIVSGSQKFACASVASVAVVGQAPFAFPFPLAGKDFPRHVFG